LLKPWSERTKIKPAEIAHHVAAYKAAGYDFIKVHNKETAVIFESLTVAARHVGLPIVGYSPLRPPPARTRSIWPYGRG
jgi:hypothetical protein